MILNRHYGQRDPRWANLKMGTTQSTIGNYGCLITCLSNMITAFSPWNTTTPKDVNDCLTGGGGYAEGDLLIWSKVPKLFPDMIDQGVDYSGRYDYIFDYLAKGETMVVCEVRLSGYGHFVLAYEAAGSGTWCLDPWDGQVKLLGTYGKIYSAHFYGDATPTVKTVPPKVTEPVVPSKPPVGVVVVPPPPEKPPVVTPPAPIVTPPSQVVIPDEKLNIGLINSLLVLLKDFINKLLGRS